MKIPRWINKSHNYLETFNITLFCNRREKYICILLWGLNNVEKGVHTEEVRI